MSYDLKMRQPPTPRPPLAPDDEAYWAWCAQYTFRLNMWAMRTVRQLLEDVLDWEAANPSFPAYVDAPEAGAPPSPERLAYEQVLAQVISSRSPLPGKVPAYKLGSNSGWVVVPEECQLLAAACRRRLAELLSQYCDWVVLIEDFAAFNERAVVYGGYEVW